MAAEPGLEVRIAYDGMKFILDNADARISPIMRLNWACATK
jgi:hypothetical protein